MQSGGGGKEAAERGKKEKDEGSSHKQGGKSRRNCLVGVGLLLLMGQPELNTTASIVR